MSMATTNCTILEGHLQKSRKKQTMYWSFKDAGTPMTEGSSENFFMYGGETLGGEELEWMKSKLKNAICRF
jgi:hypothetical protein